MTNSEHTNPGPEWVANPEHVELIGKILHDCRAFAGDIPRQVEMYYDRPDTATATRILQHTAARTLHFTNLILPHSKYFYEDPVGGYSGVAVRKVRLPDEAEQESQPNVDYMGRIIDLSLRGDTDDLSPAWQCSLYIHESQQPVLLDQELVRNLGPSIGDNMVTSAPTITTRLPYGAVYYPDNEELRTLGLIIGLAHMSQRDLATTLSECAAEAASSENIHEAAWFNAGAAYINALNRPR